jgi:hypothetical protein
MSAPGLQPDQVDEASEHRTVAQTVKDIGLFFAGPFITLAYMPLFPFIGFAMLRRAWHGGKAPT